MPNETIYGQANPTGVTGYATTTETSTNYGLWFTVSTAGTLTAIWFYSPSGATSLPTGTSLFSQTAQGTGTLLNSNASPTWSGAAGSGWVQDTTFPATSLSTGVVYDAAYFAGSGGLLQGYLYTGSSPAAWFPTTSAGGHITAPESEFGFMNAPNQSGTYQTLPASNNANNLNWLVDVTVQFAGGSGPPLNQGLLSNRPAVLVSNAGWRGAGHSR